MQYCPFCGQGNQISAITCTHCGALQPEAKDAAPPARPSKSRVSTNLAAPRNRSAGIPARGRSAGRAAGASRTRLSAQTRFLDVQSAENELRNTSPNDLRGRVKLVVEQGLIIGEQYLLSDDNIIIGRHDIGSDYCPDIELSAQDSSYVHRRHAELIFSPSGDTLRIKDLGGRNGVFVNNNMLASFGEITLGVGDNVRIGRVVLKVRSV